MKLTAKELNVEESKLGLKGSPTQVVKVFSPAPRKGGRIIEGEISEIVEELAKELKDIVISVN